LARFFCIPVEFDEDLVQTLDVLPKGWDAEPATEASRAIGAAWISVASAPLLKIPSMIIPKEHNYLLNPEHPDAAKIKIGEARPFRLDPRLV